MMKKGNATILASIFTVLLVAMGVGAGTMAWFSTTPQPTNVYTMNAAEMKMNVETTAFTFDKLVPGQAFGPIVIKITNTGTMDINFMGGDLILTDAAGNPFSSDTNPGVLLANYIEITSWRESIPNYGWIENIDSTQHYEDAVKDGQAPLTLMELAKSYWAGGGEPQNKLDQFGNWVKSTTDWVTGNGYDTVPLGYPAIPIGGTYEMDFSFKLSDGTPNPMQGKSCSFKIVFTGTQDLSILP